MFKVIYIFFIVGIFCLIWNYIWSSLDTDTVEFGRVATKKKEKRIESRKVVKKKNIQMFMQKHALLLLFVQNS